MLHANTPLWIFSLLRDSRRSRSRRDVINQKSTTKMPPRIQIIDNGGSTNLWSFFLQSKHPRVTTAIELVGVCMLSLLIAMVSDFWLYLCHLPWVSHHAIVSTHNDLISSCIFFFRDSIDHESIYLYQEASLRLLAMLGLCFLHLEMPPRQPSISHFVFSPRSFHGHPFISDGKDAPPHASPRSSDVCHMLPPSYLLPNNALFI